jgi:carboxyl-terminal processing protease
MNDNFKKYKIFLITGFLIAIAFGTGFYYGRSGKNVVSYNEPLFVKSAVSSSTVDMDTFWNVWNILDQKFVYTQKGAKTITEQEKLYGAIQGMAAAYGDPYTVFFPPTENKTFQTSISGDFEGVGMELDVKDNNIVVVAPIKGTPAYNAGVKKGDVIVSINGTSTLGMPVDDAVNYIRGKAGTNVTINILRASSTKPVEIKMTRQVINIPTINTSTKGDVFVISLYSFNALSADEFRQALRDFVVSGKSKLVLDLRGNPGGYLDSAVDMASWFLPLGDVVVRESFSSSTDDEQVYRSKGYNIFSNKLKMIILADSGTASASEILSGALQEHGIAKLVGTNTFGKGCVQELVQITPDTSLKVTVAKWLTPNGKSISDGGLTPDYQVKISDNDVKAGKDPQMDKAIQLLDN